MDSVRLDLSEYESAMGEFVFSVFWGFARLDKLVGQVADRPIIHAGPTRNVHGPTPLDQPMSQVGQELPIHFDVIQEGRIEEFIEQLHKAASEFVGQLQKFFIQSMSEVIEAAGNVTDAKGEELTFDHFLEMLERLEIRSDEDGMLNLPTLMMNADMEEKLRKLEITPEQKQRYIDLLRRKVRRI